MEQLQSFEMVLISDADEPEEAIVAGMERSHFDGVMLALVPDGEPGELGWYGTPETEDGRPTKPVLLFHRGFADAKGDGIEYVSETLELDIRNVSIVAEWERNELDMTSESRRTLEVHMVYPPYPWFEAAVIGMYSSTRNTLVQRRLVGQIQIGGMDQNKSGVDSYKHVDLCTFGQIPTEERGNAIPFILNSKSP